MLKARLRLLLLLAAGCVPSSEPPTVEEAPETSAECLTVPITPEESRLTAKSALHAPGGAPIAVFLNRHGGTYSPGANDSSRNRSSIIGTTYTMPAFDRGDTAWNNLVTCVRGQFSRFNVTITDVEPTAGNYIEAVVSGHPGDIGLSGGIGGIAPLDTYNCAPIERAVAYVFARNLGGAQHLCEITAHEVGHTLSLEHEYLCEDPMTYLTGCGRKTFQDSTAWCGTGSAVQCECRGGQQNTVQALLDLVGPAGPPPVRPEDDLAPPVAELLAPADGQTLVESSPIEVLGRATDDLLLSKVELIWDFNGQTYPCPTSQTNVTCEKQSADTYRWTIRVSTGQRTFRLRATDYAGKVTETASRTIRLTPTGQPPAPADTSAPVVTVVAPNDGEVRQPQTDVTIAADVTDDVAVEKAQLLWAFNGETYACPLSSTYVKCTVSGTRYTWTVRAGVEGARTFEVRAYDTAGNAATSPRRTIDVRTVRDTLPPAVTLVEPGPTDTLRANTEIRVTADATDDVGVSKVELIWDFNGQTYPCPHSSTYVDCDVDGARYKWRVRVGSGARTFRVRATDAAGNRAVTPDVSLQLMP